MLTDALRKSQASLMECCGASSTQKRAVCFVFLMSQRSLHESQRKPLRRPTWTWQKWMNDLRIRHIRRTRTADSVGWPSSRIKITPALWKTPSPHTNRCADVPDLFPLRLEDHHGHGHRDALLSRTRIRIFGTRTRDLRLDVADPSTTAGTR